MPVRAIYFYKSIMIWKNLTVHISFVRLRKDESNREDEYFSNDLHTLVKRTWARYNKGREFIGSII